MPEVAIFAVDPNLQILGVDNEQYVAIFFNGELKFWRWSVIEFKFHTCHRRNLVVLSPRLDSEPNRCGSIIGEKKFCQAPVPNTGMPY